MKIDGKQAPRAGLCSEERSMISPLYARNFICDLLDILPDGGRAVFLFNINYICGKERYKRVYSKGGLEALYVFSGRINCWRNNDKTIDGRSVNYAWFVFKKSAEYQTPKIYFINN